jgi:hypothetical protein
LGDHSHPAGRSEDLGTRGRLKVKGKINGFTFRTSLSPTGKADHMMLVKQANAGRG